MPYANSIVDDVSIMTKQARSGCATIVLILILMIAVYTMMNPDSQVNHNQTQQALTPRTQTPSERGSLALQGDARTVPHIQGESLPEADDAGNTPATASVLSELYDKIDEDAEYFGQWGTTTSPSGETSLYRIYRKADLLFLETFWVDEQDTNGVSRRRKKLHAVLDEGEHRFVTEDSVEDYVARRFDAEYLKVTSNGYLTVCGLDTGEFEKYPPVTMGAGDDVAKLAQLDSIKYASVTSLSSTAGDAMSSIPVLFIADARARLDEIDEAFRELQEAQRTLRPRSTNLNDLEAWGEYTRSAQVTEENLSARVKVLDPSLGPVKVEMSLLVSTLQSARLNLAFGETEQYLQAVKSLQRQLGALSSRLKTAQSGRAKSKLRLWHDSSGTYSVEARFIKRAMNSVTLQKTDNQTIEVEFDRLSKEDQEFINSHR